MAFENVRSCKARNAPELKFRLCYVWPDDFGARIGERCKRKQDRRAGIAVRASLAGNVGQVHELRFLRLVVR